MARSCGSECDTGRDLGVSGNTLAVRRHADHECGGYSSRARCSAACGCPVPRWSHSPRVLADHLERLDEGRGKFNDDLGEEWIVSRQSNVVASIVVNYYADGSSEYIVNEYIATYSLYVEQRSRCEEGGSFVGISRHKVTEPARYSRTGPVTPNTVMPYKPSLLSGTGWTINALNLLLGGIKTDHQYDARFCGGEIEHQYDTGEDFSFTEHLTSDVRTMFNSDDGPLFRYDVDATFDIEDGGVTYPLHLVEHLQVERLKGCHDTPAPIPGDWLDLKFVDLNLQAKDTTPDLDTTLQARVTCQGVPVVNAPVVVKLKAVERSGGHNHVAGKRPRGYIDGVEQTADSKFIGLTDSDGAVTFAIRPGRDLTDKSVASRGCMLPTPGSSRRASSRPRSAPISTPVTTWSTCRKTPIGTGVFHRPHTPSSSQGALWHTGHGGGGRGDGPGLVEIQL